MQENKFMQLFFELFEEAPRQGPGSFATTQQAINLCRGLPDKPRILDIGCGVGVQTLALAKLTGGDIVAVDINQTMLDHLRDNAEAEKLLPQIHPQQGDMSNLAALKLPLEGFDLVWSEGAISIMGFEKGLRAWRPYLRPGGCLGVSDMVWLQADPPEECRSYMEHFIPDLGDRENQRRIARAAGYEVLSDFIMPQDCWTTNYYVPLARRMQDMRRKYPGDPECEAVVERLQIETDLYAKYNAYFGYQFLILRSHE